MGEVWDSPEKRQSLIPGGAHTYSRGDDTFPPNAPALLARGRGAFVWDANGKRFLDWAMAVRSVSIGHAHRPIDRAAYRQARRGVNLSRPSAEEFRLANKLSDLIPSAEMVKFGKNGSDATAAAIRLARSATGRDLVLRSSQSAFLGVHDWFIGSTVMNAGIPAPIAELTEVFEYGDLKDLENRLQNNPGRVAAVILEPLGQDIPPKGYLHEVRRLVNEFGAVLIFDEVVSGFRIGMRGYQGVEGVNPDLSAFGKAIANGYPLSVLAGRSDLMELGGIRHEKERTFIMSSTYGPERSAIGAALATIDFLEKFNPFVENETVMRRLVASLVRDASEMGLSSRVRVRGTDISPNISFLTKDGSESFVLKTAFMEAMLNSGVLTGSHLFSVAACHRGRELAITKNAISSSLRFVRDNLTRLDSIPQESSGIVRPVFRQFN